MNDFGMTLAWNAARVSLVMIPAAAIYMIASRRSPLSGAWGAAMGLTVAILITIWGLVPGQEIQFGSKFKRQEIHSSPQATGANSLIGSSSVIAESNAGLETSTTTGINLRRLKGFMLGLGRHSGISITRLRACGRWFALLSIIGAIVGLTRLVFGLWAVSQCRRRGRTVEDKDVTDLLASFRIALKIRSEVELREMDDLATPATAGWLWPFIMLPSEWRNWDADELRAVLAHELAHIQRGDYGLGLLARYAVILNYLHPGVRWLSGQLQLQQELAADAIAAGIAGGRGTYLRALSSLALRQQGRVFNGPSRAFLAAQGTLIRRIDMLRVHEGLTSQSLRIRDKLFATLLLLAFAGGIATLRSPVLADEPNSDKANIRNDETLKVDSRPEPFDLSYLTESAQGFAAIRPAALFRRPGMARFGALFNAESHKGLLPLAMQLGIKLAEAEKGPLRVEMIEQASCSIQVETMDVKEGPKHRIITHTLMARTIEPFDWLKLARDWKLELTEVAVGDRKYFKVEGKLASYLGPKGKVALFCPDTRTILFDDERVIVELLRRDKKATSPYLKAKGWDKLSRSLVALAIDNRNGKWTKDLEDLPVDEKPPVEHVGFWCGGLAADDEIVLEGFATCKDASAAESTSKAVDKLIKGLQQEVVKPPPGPKSDLAFTLFTGLYKNIRVSHDGTTVNVRSSTPATLADFGDVMTQGN